MKLFLALYFLMASGRERVPQPLGRTFTILLLGGTLLILFMSQTSVQAQVARIEFYPVATSTLTDQELLNGQIGKPVMIAGELSIPKPGKDKLPTVVILHGSSGPGGSNGTTADWSRQLNALGIVTFGLDCFAGRGIVSTSTDQGKFGRLNMIVDAYHALELLAHHPRIDPKKIVLLGVSRGGQGALYAAMKRIRITYGPPDVEFAGFLALYPNCNTTYRDDGVTTGKPILILHGTTDNYNPIAPCRAYVSRAKKAGANIRLLEYEGGEHAFDAEALRKPIQCQACQTDRHCRLAEKDGGVIVNLETQKPFSYSDACVEKGTTLAYSEEQGPKARTDALEFLQKLFGLK